MEGLRRARRPVRREFDGLHRDLEALFGEEKINEDRISLKFKLLTDCFEFLLTQDTRLLEQMTIDKVGEAEEDREFDEIREYKIKMESMRMKKEKLALNRAHNSTESVVGGSSAEVKVRDFKLPTVELPKFSGDLKEWLGWWAQYEKIHDDPQMSGSVKFSYLMQYLKTGTEAYELASAYPLTNENYPKVIEELKKMYGKEDVLLQVYIRDLLSLVIANVNSKEKTPIKTLYLKLNSHLRALKSLNLEKADPATWLFPLVESSLPENILYNWQRSPLSTHDGSSDDPPRNRLDLLMSFVEKEVEIRQRIDITRSFSKEQAKDDKPSKSSISTTGSRFPKKTNYSTLSAFFNAEQRECVFCGRQNHRSTDCYKGKAMPYEEKIKILRAKGLCFRCCGNHIRKQCKEKVECDTCQGNHYTILCKDSKRRNNDNGATRSKRARVDQNHTEVQVVERTTQANSVCTPEVALQTIMVNIQNGDKHEVVRAFIDSGSQRSYILSSTARRMGMEPTGIEHVVHSLFGGRKTNVVTHKKYMLTMGSVMNDFQFSAEVRDSDHLTTNIPRVLQRNAKIMEELKSLNVKLSDEGHGTPNIELMIGADVYPQILTRQILKLDCGAAAIYTRLGWTLMGHLGVNPAEENMANVNLSMLALNSTITQLWDLETLGIRDPTEVKSKQDMLTEARDDFIRSVTRSPDGRYCIRLPWKLDKALLPPNKEVAFKRLESSTKKLIQLKLYDEYNKIFVDWEKEHFIEKVSGVEAKWGGVHYLPHRAHLKESLTTPVRPVFDASCRTGKFPSLNDCLHTGDNYVQMIPELVYKFRERKVGFVADIRKAFQMISVDERDRDSMRFLWWSSETPNETIEYRHVRVMFGVTCSPFILGAILHHHLTTLPEGEADMGKKLLSTFYVDNCVNSVDSMAEYSEFKERSVKIMDRAKMELRMWLSNMDTEKEEATAVISVLGLLWNREKDVLFINMRGLKVPENVTKRVVLSTVSKVFDPIGFSCPAVLPMKILLQRAWLSKKKWDELLPEEETRLFMQWFRDLKMLGNVCIPRMFTGGVSDRSKWSIHTMVDACKFSYAAAVFLRVDDDGDVKVQLLAARARVAPVKPLTIPRLELMGCVIGARLTVSVKKALDVEDVNIHYWCDSTTALAWIQREDQWGTFVANRVADIATISHRDQWRHISGRLNMADLPSRGCSPSQLLLSKWWEGPSWLYWEPELWPVSNEQPDENEVNKDRKKIVEKLTFTSVNILTVDKQQSWKTKVRIFAWIKRFIHNKFTKIAESRRTGPLCHEELKHAELLLVRELQREAFPEGSREQLSSYEIMEDELGILRVKTRLTYREDIPSFKYPMILPRQRPEVIQLISDYHREYCHAGAGFLMVKLRSKYWILKARQVIKKVISRCPKCRRFSSKCVMPEAAPLPLDRVREAQVFEVTGIDLAGPLLLKSSKDEGRKVWIVIFTCAVYRAVHFELVSSLSTKAFIRSLGKFIKKFRRPSTIYTDNGTNFRGAVNLFKKLDWDEIAKDQKVVSIQWKFNPVHSAWWGGWWERLIRTTKDLLKRTVGKATLSWKELECILETREDAMNHRPLTYVSEDVNDLEPLTPALFLHPLGGVEFPEEELSEAQKLRFRLNYMKTLQRELKNRFLKEYLAYLVNRNPKKPTKPLQVGQLVLVGMDNRKRLDWPLGKVMENITGKDGVCRLARVKLSNGECVRSVQRLFPLELDAEEQVRKDLQENVVKTRSGRVIVPPQRFE